MHGILHRSLKQYVIDRADDDGWEIVTGVAGVERDMYLPVMDYPDEEALDVLAAVAELTDHPEEDVQVDFGRYFAPGMLDTFDALLPPDVDGLGAIAALDRIYPEVVSKDGPADSVELSTSRPDEDTVVIEYDSRRDLSAMLEGIARGIAAEYALQVSVDRESSPIPDRPDCTLTVRRR
jgi:hypothetical protein